MSDSSPHNGTRIRFDGAVRTPTPDGRETITVHLTWDGELHEGEASGVQTREGDIRTSALATLAATRKVLAGDGPELDLIGVKALRAFDAFVVIVSVDVRDADTRRKVIGARTGAEPTLIDAAATATLDALNRLLETYLS